MNIKYFQSSFKKLKQDRKIIMLSDLQADIEEACKLENYERAATLHSLLSWAKAETYKY